MDKSPHPAKEAPFSNVPIEVRVSVGRARTMIRDLIALEPEAILTLDRRIDDPVEVFIGDKLIARGVLEEADDSQDGLLAVRITEVADVSSHLE